MSRNLQLVMETGFDGLSGLRGDWSNSCLISVWRDQRLYWLGEFGPLRCGMRPHMSEIDDALESGSIGPDFLNSRVQVEL